MPNLCINQKGDVIAVEYNQEKSTIKNPSDIKKGIKAMYKYKYSQNLNAPLEQCGEFKVIIETTRGLRRN